METVFAGLFELLQKLVSTHWKQSKHIIKALVGVSSFD